MRAVFGKLGLQEASAEEILLNHHYRVLRICQNHKMVVSDATNVERALPPKGQMNA